MNATQDTVVALEECSVLIVEDDVLLALDLQRAFEEEGYVVLGPIKSVKQALGLLERELPDAAVLDLNLSGEESTPVAAALLARNVPFIVTSGYGRRMPVDQALQDAAWLNKPIQHEELVRLLRGILGQAWERDALRQSTS